MVVCNSTRNNNSINMTFHLPHYKVSLASYVWFGDCFTSNPLCTVHTLRCLPTFRHSGCTNSSWCSTNVCMEVRVPWSSCTCHVYTMEAELGHSLNVRESIMWAELGGSHLKALSLKKLVLKWFSKEASVYSD